MNPPAAGPDRPARLTRADVGVWLWRGRPSGAPASGTPGGGRLVARCLPPTYRTRLLRPGDRVAVYLGQPRAEVVEIGRLTDVVTSPDGPVSAATPLTSPAVSALRYESILLDVPIGRAALTDAGITDAEFQRAPQAPNPSFLTPAGARRLEGLLDAATLRDAGWVT